LIQFRKFKRAFDFVTIGFISREFCLDVKTCTGEAKQKEKKIGSNVGWQPDINKCNAHGPSDALALQTKGPRISRFANTPAKKGAQGPPKKKESVEGS
jgi:hypothetical protein